MNEVLRFISIRSPEPASSDAGLSLDAATPFQRSLANPPAPQPHGLAGPPPASRVFPLLRGLADQFIANDPGFIKKLSDSADGRALLDLADALENGQIANSAALVQKALGDTPANVWAKPAVQTLRDSIADSILAIFFSPKGHIYALTPLIRAFRSLDVVRRLAAGDKSFASDADLDAAMDKTVVVPPTIWVSNPGQPRPVGVADLLLVKQHILRYELGEIADVENILKGEMRRKDVRRGTSNEQTISQEQERTTENEQSTQSTDRFAVKSEVDKLMKEDLSIKAGVNLGYSGGGFTFGANVGVDYSQSKSESSKQASEFAKEVITRAVSKVTDRVKTSTTIKIVETTDNNEEHVFDNKLGGGHVSGIYRFIDQIDQAQVFNYGKRLLFDFTIPEPSALIWEQARQSQKANLPPEPPAFAINPADIDLKHPAQWQKYLAQYQVDASSIPPPLDNLTVAKTLSFNPDAKNADQGAEVAIADGFRAVSVTVQGGFDWSKDDNHGIDVFVGDIQVRLDSMDGPSYNQKTTVNFAAPQYGAVPVGVEVWNVDDYSVTVDLQCEPTAKAIALWQQQMHAAILKAAQKQRLDWQEAVRNAKTDNAQPSPLVGQNPETNRRIERDELKRMAITMLSGNDLTGFNDLVTEANPPRYPRPSIAQAAVDGRMARFFEQAFEWEKMGYFFYPYFWGRKSEWYDRVTVATGDELYDQFLRAGQARVVIPVRPSFEPAMAYFLMTGQLWEGGDPPDVTDSNYLSIAQETKEASGAPGDEKPVDEPWEVKLPTNFVLLQSDSKLPTWTRASLNDWKWTPDNT